MKASNSIILAISFVFLFSSLSKNHASAQNCPMAHHSMSMDLGTSDAKLDLRFIDAMIPHHEGALVMAKEALQKSQRQEIKKLASEIIKAQEAEIAQLKQWRKLWYPSASKTPMAWHAQMGHSMTMTDSQRKAMMMDVDLGKADQNFDLRFINAMIPHHEGALVMAKDVQKKTKRPEVKQLAQNILDSQKKEIEQMKQWRQSWYSSVCK